MSTDLSPRPIFVVIEGLPGCLTTEVATGVAARYNRPVWHRPWSVMPVLRRAIERECADHPQAGLLHKAALTLSLRAALEAELHEGHPVVIDGYLLSALVPAAVRGVEDHLEGIVRQILKPHITYYLHAPLEIRRSRVRSNEVDARRTLEPDRHNALDAGYRARDRHPISGDFKPVDATGSVEDIVKQVVKDIESRKPPRWDRE